MDTRKRMALGCGRVFFRYEVEKAMEMWYKKCSISAIIVTELWKESLC